MQARPETTAPRSHHGQLLLEAAANLIEKRVGALRRGVAPLHPIDELELAAQTIRRLAAELGRIYDGRAIEEPGTASRAASAPTVRAPPVLVRSSAKRAA